MCLCELTPLDLCDIFQNILGMKQWGIHPKCYTNTLVTYFLSRWVGDRHRIHLHS